MREWPEFAEVTCLAIACPSCMTLDLARSCSTYVTTIINGADLIPTVSAGQPTLLALAACKACLLAQLQPRSIAGPVMMTSMLGLQSLHP